MVASLFAVCVAGSISGCNHEQVSGSSISIRITGGYSDVKSSDITFKCSNADVSVEAVTVYWRSDVPEKRTEGLVPREAYVVVWKRIAELGIWELTDKLYSGEDFLTYSITVGTRSRTHRVVVQNPRDQDDQRYNQIVKEVMGLFDAVK